MTPPGRTPRPGAAATGGQDVAVVLATQVGKVVFAVATQAILAHALLPEGRGSYALCVAFAIALGALFTPGAQEGAQHAVMTRRATVSEAVSAAMAICLVGGGIAMALATPLVQSEIAFFQKAETHAFHLALPLIPLVAFSVAVEHQLAALRRFRRLALFTVLHAAANVLLLLALVWVWRLGVAGAIAAYAVGYGCMVFLCVGYLRRHHGLVPANPFRPVSTEILGYGLRFHAARSGGALETSMGTLVLGLLASRAEIGLFAVASVMMLQLRMISNAVGNALLPRIAGEGRQELTVRCLRLVCWATLAALLAVLAVGTPLVRILLSEAFLPAVPLLWVIAPGVLAFAAAGILMTWFRAVNRPEICSWAVLLGLAVNLAAIPLLWPALGIEAAAWALSLGMACRWALLTVAFARATGMGGVSIWLPQRGDAAFARRAVESVANMRLGRLSR